MKWMKKKYVIVFLFVFSMVFGRVLLYGQENDFDNEYKILVQSQERILNVPYIQQPLNTQWCWAASAAMVLGSYGLYVKTEQVVLAVFHVLNPNQTGSEHNILQGLAFGNVRYRVLPGSMTLYDVKQIIDRGSPIIICYQGSFAGHAVVLVGYNIAKGTVVIFDPVFGKFYGVPFGNSLIYGSMRGPLFWRCSLIPY